MNKDSNNPKIAFLSDSITPNMSGVGKTAYNYLKELSKLTDNVYLIDFKKKKYLKKYCKRQIIISTLPIFKNISWHFKILKKIEHIDFDLIFNPSFFPNVIGSSSNLVYILYDLSMFKFPQRSKFGKRLYFKLFLPLTLRKSRKIIAISKNTKSDAINLLNCSSEKTEVVYLGTEKIYEKKPSKIEIEKVRSKYGLPQNFFLFVSTIEPRKNVSNLLKAFDIAYPQTKIPIVFVGNKGWRFKKIKKTYSRIKNKDKIKFTGYVSNKDLSAIYRIASCLVYPSLYEGFGIPCLEAMISECPVITSNVSSLPEVCGNAALYVDPYNVSEIAQAMVNIINDKGLRKKLIRRGKKQAKKFSWKKSTKKIFSKYI